MILHSMISFKRILDILFASVLLVLFAPLILVLLIISYLSTGEYPLFRQARSLANLNRTFKIYKIRTMKSIPDSNYAVSNILSREDLYYRVTGAGKWMRRTGLDELPQLINVLRGDMSLVGPRPLSTSDIEILKVHHPKIYARREKLSSLPGITGYWQVLGKREKGLYELIEKDEMYEKKKSLFLDAGLVVLTMPIILFARHSDSVLGELKESKHVNAAGNYSDILMTK